MSYDPTIGRWLETDPAGYVDGMNDYQFVRSNPADFTDPSGFGIGQFIGNAARAVLDRGVAFLSDAAVNGMQESAMNAGEELDETTISNAKTNVKAGLKSWGPIADLYALIDSLSPNSGGGNGRGTPTRLGPGGPNNGGSPPAGIDYSKVLSGISFTNTAFTLTPTADDNGILGGTVSFRTNLVDKFEIAPNMQLGAGVGVLVKTDTNLDKPKIDVYPALFFDWKLHDCGAFEMKMYLEVGEGYGGGDGMGAQAGLKFNF